MNNQAFPYLYPKLPFKRLNKHQQEIFDICDDSMPKYFPTPKQNKGFLDKRFGDSEADLKSTSINYGQHDKGLPSFVSWSNMLPVNLKPKNTNIGQDDIWPPSNVSWPNTIPLNKESFLSNPNNIPLHNEHRATFKPNTFSKENG